MMYTPRRISERTRDSRCRDRVGGFGCGEGRSRMASTLPAAMLFAPITQERRHQFAPFPA